MIHGAVPWLRNIVLTLWVTFILCAAVNTLLNDCPSHVVVWKFTLLNRTRCWQTCENSCKWKQHIMEVTRMIKAWTLICDLQAALPHTKGHCIHVNLPWERLIFRRFMHVGIFVLVERHSYANFFTSPFSYRFYQAAKSRMSINSFIQDKSWAWKRVHCCNVVLICKFIPLFFELFVLNFNVVLSAETRGVRQACNANVIWLQKLFENFPPDLQLLYARQKLFRVGNALVRFCRHCFNHPASELWHQYNTAFSCSRALVENLDEFRSSIRQSIFSFWTIFHCWLDMQLILHLFAPLQLVQRYRLIFMRRIQWHKLFDSMSLIPFNFVFVL